MLDKHKVVVPKANPKNHVIPARYDAMKASDAENIAAVFNMGDTPQVPFADTYRIVGQPVSKG